MTLRTTRALPEIHPGDDLARIVADAADGITPGDIVVVAHKVVSKAEGRIVHLEEVTPGREAQTLADETGKDPALVEVILRESRRIVRRRGGTLICETRHGFVCANAGVDASNVPAGTVVVLPIDPDRSARHLQTRLAARAGGRVGVVVSDTHGRAFRRGILNIAIGVAGFSGLIDHRGGRDREGRILVATEEALADEVAAAAGILMGKSDGTPVVIVSGVSTAPDVGTATTLVRNWAHDLFRGP